MKHSKFWWLLVVFVCIFGCRQTIGPSQPLLARPDYEKYTPPIAAEALARDAAQSQVKAHPSSPKANWDMATAEYVRGDYKSALKLFKKCKSLAPDRVATRLCIAYCCRAMDDPRASIRELESSLGLHMSSSERSDVYLTIANANYDLKLNDLSLLAYQKSIALNPSQGGAYFGMGLIYAGLRKTREAEESFKLAEKHADSIRTREKARAAIDRLTSKVN